MITQSHRHRKSQVFFCFCSSISHNLPCVCLVRASAKARRRVVHWFEAADNSYSANIAYLGKTNHHMWTELKPVPSFFCQCRVCINNQEWSCVGVTFNDWHNMNLLWWAYCLQMQVPILDLSWEKWATKTVAISLVQDDFIQITGCCALHAFEKHPRFTTLKLLLGFKISVRHPRLKGFRSNQPFCKRVLWKQLILVALKTHWQSPNCLWSYINFNIISCSQTTFEFLTQSYAFYLWNQFAFCKYILIGKCCRTCKH